MTDTLKTALVLHGAGVATLPTKADKARARTAAWRKANPGRNAASAKAWRVKNPERSKALIARWYRNNKPRAKANAARWYKENAILCGRRVTIWTSANRDKVRKYKRDRFRMLPLGSIEKIKGQLRTRINMALGKGRKRGVKTESLIGCTIAQFKDHISRLFLPGMSWGNRNKWHIDHDKPCRLFDLTKASEQKRCFHFTNLQPLWATENLRKNDKTLVGVVLISARKI